MKNFTMQDLKRLSEVEAELCISIFMPTDPEAVGDDEQRIRFKNLLRRAEKDIQENSGRKKELYGQIEKGRSLLDDRDFWRRQADGLAVFIAPEVFLYYRLPVSFEEEYAVGRRFHLKPLIPLFMADGRFYILALSQNEIRLFSCTRHHVSEIELEDVPDGIAESLRYDHKQYQLQFHTGAAGGGGARPAVFHGHGVSVDDKKDEILRYFQDVDRGLSDILPDREVPLVLAGVDYLLPIFREATSYGWVLEEAVTGNPEDLRPEELHRQALDAVLPVLEQKQREAEARYRELAGKGYTAAGVEAVVPAAAFGRADTLFVRIDERRPGTFDKETNEIRLGREENEASAEDLLDLAAVETIRNGGRVYAVKEDRMPEKDAAAVAILRY